jgi:hypothetical protein
MTGTHNSASSTRIVSFICSCSRKVLSKREWGQKLFYMMRRANIYSRELRLFVSSARVGACLFSVSRVSISSQHGQRFSFLERSVEEYHNLSLPRSFDNVHEKK